MKFIQKFLKANWPILLVLLLVVFLRFWRWEDSIIFSLEENNVLYTLEKFVNGNWSPLLGLEATGYVHHLFHTPWYVYLFSLVFRLSGGEPLVFNYIHTGLGVVAVLIWYLIGLRLKNRKLGVIASLLTATSYLLVSIDHTAWAVGLIPFATTVAIYLAVSAAKTKKSIWLWLLGTWLGFTLSLHYQVLVLIAGILIWGTIVFRRKIVFVAVPVIISLFPLIVFDLRHGFFNLYGFYLATTIILSGGSPYSSGHFFYFVYPFMIFAGAWILSKINLFVSFIIIAVYLFIQTNLFISKVPEKSYPLKNKLVETLLDKYNGNKLKIFFDKPDSFEYKYLLFLRARQRGINVGDIVISERWQPHDDAQYIIEKNKILKK